MTYKKTLFYTVVFLLSFALLGSQFLNPSFPLGSALVTCVFFASLLLGFVKVIAKSTRRIFLTVSAISLLAILSYSLLDKRRFNRTLDSSNLIITNLERFKKEKGSFPDGLNELIPNYLKEIPKNASGDDFYYVRFESDTSDYYQIKYYSKMGVVATYHNTEKRWYYDD